MSRLQRLGEAWARRLVLPLARPLARLGVNPNLLTLGGLALSIGVGLLAAGGYFPWAGALWLAVGALDLMDGAVARLTGRSSPFGAVLDSTADRLSEAVVLGGIVAFYASRGEMLPVYLAFAALAASFLVSYVRARAEGVGLAGEAGIMARGERVVLLALGFLLGLVPWALGIIAALAAVTVVQRLWLAWRQSRR